MGNWGCGVGGGVVGVWQHGDRDRKSEKVIDVNENRKTVILLVLTGSSSSSLVTFSTLAKLPESNLEVKGRFPILVSILPGLTWPLLLKHICMDTHVTPASIQITNAILQLKTRSNMI